jgi:choline kinase
MSAPLAQAVILAAGRGRRLGTAGDRHPKCLLPVAGRPLLTWTLDALHRCGIDRVLAIGGWQGEQLSGLGVELALNPHWETSGAVRSLMLADAWLRRAPTLVLYGDGAYAATTLAQVAQADAAPLLVPGDRRWLALWRRRFADPLQDAETWHSRDGWLEQIGARPVSLQQASAQFMGLLRPTPDGWSGVRAWLARCERERGAAHVDGLDMTMLLQHLIDAGMRIATLEFEGGWVEIDSLEDRAAVECALDEEDFVHDFR